MFANGKSEGFISMDAPGSLFFRCVNRFDGCNQLFKQSHLLDEHKKLCSKRSNILYECPICIETIKYCSYNLYMHFEEEHPKLFLKNTAMFNVEVETELQQTYLYCKNDLLFFVRVSYCKSDEELTLNTLHLGSEENAWKISQNFTLQTIDGKVRYTIKGKHCSAVNGKVFEKKIQICVDDFPKNVVVCEFDLNTEHVDTIPILPKDDKQKCGTLAPVNGEDISVESVETALKGMTVYATATKSVGTIPKGTFTTVNSEETSVKSTATSLKGIKSTKKTRTATKSVGTVPKEVKASRGRRNKNERPFNTYFPTRQPRQSYCSSSQYEPCLGDEYEDCSDYEYPEYEYNSRDYECFSEY